MAKIKEPVVMVDTTLSGAFADLQAKVEAFKERAATLQRPTNVSAVMADVKQVVEMAQDAGDILSDLSIVLGSIGAQLGILGPAVEVPEADGRREGDPL